MPPKTKQTNSAPAKTRRPQSSTARRTKTPKAPARVPGMGAIVHAGGVAFRVWAPNAQQVTVIGEFNHWDQTAHPMESEGNGYWYANIAEAKPGQEYRYYLTTPNGEFGRIDPYARAVTNSVGNAIILDPGFDWQGDDFRLPNWNELVIYEMHIGSFTPDADEQPGTFQKVLAQIGHLKRLGVNAVQIMPVAEFAGDRSWGYNPAHIFAVESAYGGPNGLKAFVREMHKNGIGVILDVVYNHFGPSDLDLWRFDGWSEGDGGGIYFYNDWRSDTPWGNSRPDYGRGEVRQFIYDNAMMWLDEYHMDGLRMDMTLFIRSVRGPGSPDLPEGWGLLQWINRDIAERFPGRITIAEDLQNSEWITKPADEGGAGFGAQWDAQFVHPIRGAVIAAGDPERSMPAVAHAIGFKYNNSAFQRAIYSESHDEVANGKARVPQEIAPGDAQNWFAQKRSTLAAALVFTAPGIPMLFQGQEFLQGEWFRDDVPLDWDQSEEYRGIVRLYHDLIRLRLNRNGYSGGLAGQNVHVFHVNNAQNVIAFRRWGAGGPGDDVVVVANFSTAPAENYQIGFPSDGEWKVRLNSDARAYSRDFEGFSSPHVSAQQGDYDGLPCHGALNVAPYSVLILSQDAK